MDLVKLGLEAALLIGGFVAVVMVMRQKLDTFVGQFGVRLDRIENEIRPLAAQLTALSKDGEMTRRDQARFETELEKIRQSMSRLERSVLRLQAHQDEAHDAHDTDN